jgi:hypothetical protein
MMLATSRKIFFNCLGTTKYPSNTKGRKYTRNIELLKTKLEFLKINKIVL